MLFGAKKQLGGHSLPNAAFGDTKPFSPPDVGRAISPPTDNFVEYDVAVGWMPGPQMSVVESPQVGQHPGVDGADVEAVARRQRDPRGAHPFMHALEHPLEGGVSLPGYPKRSPSLLDGEMG